MAKLLGTNLLGERAARVRAHGSLGLSANRNPELQEGRAADRADLAAAEETGECRGPERCGGDARVVVGRGEHVRAAAVAGEEQRSDRPAAAECVSKRLVEV